MYAEIFNSHFKTSTGGGTAQPILVLNEAVAPSTNYGYVHIAGSDWEDVYGDGGTTPHPYFIKSANTVHEGAMLDIGYLNVFSTTEPTIQIAYTGPYTRSILYSRAVNYFKSSGTWP
ncbi:MAG: hypothetical protein JO306_12535 [Gemmatimonadetes bacterium]|nr:hypothetical protein [Gemmatimonadota bacterium]